MENQCWNAKKSGQISIDPQEFQSWMDSEISTKIFKWWQHFENAMLPAYKRNFIRNFRFIFQELGIKSHGYSDYDHRFFTFPTRIRIVLVHIPLNFYGFRPKNPNSTKVFLWNGKLHEFFSRHEFIETSTLNWEVVEEISCHPKERVMRLLSKLCL